MKVAVSIPDPVFAEAEMLAARLQTSRSAIYVRALEAYISTHAPDRTTQAMNDALDAIPDQTNEFRAVAAKQVFDRVEW